MKSDALDVLLTDYFRPEPIPPALTRRIVAGARKGGRTMETLANELSIRATPRGVALVGPHGRRRAAGEDHRGLADRARRELGEYLAGKRVFFSVPVDLSGLPEFQRRVLEEARRIPYGEARSYSWIARRIGRPRAVRAVGTALGRNPVPFIVPCHRVLRSDGSLGGYAFGLGLKERLLKMERSTPVLEGCTSTGIVCRVGCSAGQRMRDDRRVNFASLQDARTSGYRPCRVCRPAA
jgi:O-6-methylguanine DNA methyltransferase